MHNVAAITQLSSLKEHMLHIVFQGNNSAARYIPFFYHELITIQLGTHTMSTRTHSNAMQTAGDAVRILALIPLVYLLFPTYVILLSLCYLTVFVFHPPGVPHLVSETLLVYQKR